MPMYTYRCKRCGNVSDRLVKMAERDAPQTCDRTVPALAEQVPAIEAAPVEPTCNGEMAREEITITARTPSLWKFNP